MMSRMAFVAVLSGVASAAYAGPDPDLGSSVRANVAAQVIDMHPDYAGRSAVTSGRRASDAVIRYQTGKLKPLLRTNGKTDIGSQGGAGDEPTVSIPLISSGKPE